MFPEWKLNALQAVHYGLCLEVIQDEKIFRKTLVWLIWKSTNTEEARSQKVLIRLDSKFNLRTWATNFCSNWSLSHNLKRHIWIAAKLRDQLKRNSIRYERKGSVYLLLVYYTTRKQIPPRELPCPDQMEADGRPPALRHWLHCLDQILKKDWVHSI